MKKNKSLLLYVGILLIVSIIIGFIYGINNSYDLTNYIENLNTKNNLIFTHIFILLVFLFSSLSFLGLLVQSIYLAFEGISIGYLLGVFFTNYKVSGIVFGAFNILINKGVFIICLIYLFIVGYHYFKKTISNLIGNNKDYLIFLIKPLLQKYGIISIVLIIYDLIIYFFGNMFLNYLTFML